MWNKTNQSTIISDWPVNFWCVTVKKKKRRKKKILSCILTHMFREFRDLRLSNSKKKKTFFFISQAWKLFDSIFFFPKMNNLWKTGQIATLYITIKAKRKKVKVIFFWHRSEKHPISVFGLFVTKINSMTVKPVRHLKKKEKGKT